GGDQLARAQRLRPLDRDDVERDQRGARRAVVEDERLAQERVARALAGDRREPAGDVEAGRRGEVDPRGTETKRRRTSLTVGWSAGIIRWVVGRLDEWIVGRGPAPAA